MDWNSIATEIILSLVGLVISAASAFIAYFIKKHFEDEKVQTILSNFHDLVRKSVLETYQVYVEELKDKNMFDAEAQKTALSACLELIKGNMSRDVETWLKSNVSNVEAYLKDEIEAQIGALKNSGK